MGEELPFFLEPTQPPSWSQQPWVDWRQERGTVVRLRLECQRDGWDPWTLAFEIDTATRGRGTVEVP